MSRQQSRAASQGDATPPAGRAVAEADVQVFGADVPTGLTAAEVQRHVPFRDLYARDDVRDQLRNVGRAMWSNAGKPAPYQAGFDTAYLLLQAADAIDALASRAAQATPAEGAEEQEPGECADCGTLLVQSEDAFCEDCEGMRRAACRRQPAGAADRTRGAGEDTLDEQWLKSIEARMSGDPAAVTALLGEIRGYLRAASHAIRDRDTRIDALEQECATLREDAAIGALARAWWEDRREQPVSYLTMCKEYTALIVALDAARAGRPAGEGDHA
jgi:hypothetical protein